MNQCHYYCVLPLNVLQYVTRFWVKNIEYLFSLNNKFIIMNQVSTNLISLLIDMLEKYNEICHCHF